MWGHSKHRWGLQLNWESVDFKWSGTSDCRWKSRSSLWRRAWMSIRNRILPRTCWLKDRHRRRFFKRRKWRLWLRFTWWFHGRNSFIWLKWTEVCTRCHEWYLDCWVGYNCHRCWKVGSIEDNFWRYRSKYLYNPSDLRSEPCTKWTNFECSIKCQNQMCRRCIFRNLRTWSVE